MKSAWAVFAVLLALLIPDIVFGLGSPISNNSVVCLNDSTNFRLKSLLTSINISIPLIDINNADSNCDGSIHQLAYDHMRIYVELLYRPLGGPTSSMLTLNENLLLSIGSEGNSVKDGNIYARRLERQVVRLFNNTNIATLSAQFPCWALSQPGFYAVRTTDQLNRTLNTELVWTQLMNAENSDNSISTTLIPLTLCLRNDSIFPSCRNDFTVSWQLPDTCDVVELGAALDFRVRVFASTTSSDAQRTPAATNLFRNVAYALNGNAQRRKRADNDMLNGFNDASDWLYVGELTAKWTDSRHALISIPCVQFDIIYEAFCFELVSIERLSNHVELWDRKCVSTEPRNNLPRERVGYWSEWSIWSHCHSCGLRLKTPCCGTGDAGYRKRRRYCMARDMAASQHQSADGCADGNFTEIECCALPPHVLADGRRSEALHAVDTGAYRPLSTLDCNCGCNLRHLFGNSSGGAFYAFRKPECGRITFSVWKLGPSPDKNVDMRLIAQISPVEPVTNIVNLRIVAESESSRSRRLLWSSESLSSDEDEGVGSVKQLSTRVFAGEQLIFNLSLRTASISPYLTYVYNTGFYVDFLLRMEDPLIHLLPESADASSTFSMLRHPLSILLSTLADCNFEDSTSESCEQWLAILSAACAILLLIIVLALPPAICAFLSRRFASIRYSKTCLSPTKKRLRSDLCAAREFLILEHDRQLVPSEMLHSGDTNSTQTTACNVTSALLNENIIYSRESTDLNITRPVTKRSIGIQLSRQSTPRLASRNDFNNNQKFSNNSNEQDARVKMRSCVDDESSLKLHSTENTEPTTTTLDELADCGTESGTDGLEYDYYEPPPLPSSFLANAHHQPVHALLGEEICEFVSEIDIDEIVREEAPSIAGGWRTADRGVGACWSKELRVFATQDAHTQISELL